MKKIILSITLLSSLIAAKAQNLINNGDLEQYSPCPGTLGEFTATYWVNPNTASTDYFNACNTTTVGVPSNFIGYQFAHSGMAYCGMDIFTQPPFVTEYREYAEASLTAPLTAGNCYHFEMWINHSNNSQYATDDIGAYFSNTLITGVTNWNALPYIPQVSNTTGFITDTANWVLVSGNFTAAGGESYVIIGNFKDDANTTFQQISTQGNQFTYYLFDDLSLTNCTGINQFTVSNPQFEVNPNPVENELFILNYSLAGEEKTKIIITDVSGRIVRVQNLEPIQTKINVTKLISGIYFIEIEGGKNSYRKKFLKL
ncbi:MAG: T9SS type A sorting domain-containing protein [Bacteroidota bacterium]